MSDSSRRNLFYIIIFISIGKVQLPVMLDLSINEEVIRKNVVSDPLQSLIYLQISMSEIYYQWKYRRRFGICLRNVFHVVSIYLSFK